MPARNLNIPSQIHHRRLNRYSGVEYSKIKLWYLNIYKTYILTIQRNIDRANKILTWMPDLRGALVNICLKTLVAMTNPECKDGISAENVLRFDMTHLQTLIDVSAKSG